VGLLRLRDEYVRFTHQLFRYAMMLSVSINCCTLDSCEVEKDRLRL